MMKVYRQGLLGRVAFFLMAIGTFRVAKCLFLCLIAIYFRFLVRLEYDLESLSNVLQEFGGTLFRTIGCLLEAFAPKILVLYYFND